MIILLKHLKSKSIYQLESYLFEGDWLKYFVSLSRDFTGKSTIYSNNLRGNFYFSYIAFFKNYIDDKNRIMKLNISIYENLMYKDPEVEKNNQKDSSIQEKKNDKDELY